jgi:hypothetical protein
MAVQSSAGVTMMAPGADGPSSTRRKYDRRRVMVNAFVHRGDRFQHVRVVNYSHGGLQLDGTFGLMPRDAIEVELVSGLRIAARVVWSLGGRTGVMFPVTLSPAHPVMVELGRRERPSA